MLGEMQKYLTDQVARIKGSGLFKEERVITSPQASRISIKGGRLVLNMCANNYLGLASHPEVVKAAQEGLARWGYGLSSVRFICGTQSIHKDLEARLANFLGVEDAILYSSCFDANGGLFETLLSEEDAVISDELNHASIIDGIRLCKAKRFRYKTSDMDDLEIKLKEATGSRFRLIATDGVFSMDGAIARLDAVCDLAERYSAAVMIDDSHAVGFLGPGGRGTHEYRGVMGRVDIITGTLGKALGGASGGYTAGRREIIALLRQRSRPYLFSNTLAPAVCAASIKAIDMLSASSEFRDRLMDNAGYFRRGMATLGFKIKDGEHPIVPIILGDALLAQQMAASMLEKGVYVIGFFYPVVPQGAARIRVQITAAHTREDLDFALSCFDGVKKEFGI